MAREKTLARKEEREAGLAEPWDTFADMERMFRNFLAPTSYWRTPRWIKEMRREFMPEVDLRETEKELILSATVPGLEKDDIDINVTHDQITIKGERKHEEEKPEERYHVRQQSYGSFEVCYALPTEVKAKQAKASYKNGVLEVKMPKTAETEMIHKVPVEE